MTLETRNTNTEKVKRVKIQLQTGLINAQSSIYEFSSDNKFTQSWKNTEAFSANCTINHQSRCQNHWKPWKFRTNVSWMVVRYLQNFNCQLICQFILIWWHCTWETKEKKNQCNIWKNIFFSMEENLTRKERVWLKTGDNYLQSAGPTRWTSYSRSPFLWPERNTATPSAIMERMLINTW